MRYALLVCFDEGQTPDADGHERRYAAHDAFRDELEASGRLVSPLDEAIGLAARIPAVDHGTVDVGPVWKS